VYSRLEKHDLDVININLKPKEKTTNDKYRLAGAVLFDHQTKAF